MTDQTPQRDQPQPPRDDARPVMGDHPDLELDDQARTQPAESGDNPMAKLMIPGIIVLVVMLIIIAFLVF